ncbi:MAG: hypothetical protein Q4A47_03010 [Erysipelotrichaceae bacterium]|nr:hypothetical protein [Erysipelotrichaceae bacterium]
MSNMDGWTNENGGGIFTEIRSRSVDENLDKKLKTVWFSRGYSRASVKEYISHLQAEMELLQDNYKDHVKEIMDEKERLAQEKTLLMKQLEESQTPIVTNEEKVRELESQIAQMKAELDQHGEAKVRLLESKIESLTKELETNDANVLVDFQNRIDELSNELNLSQQNANELNLYCENLESQLEQANQKINTLNQSITSLNDSAVMETTKTDAAHKEEVGLLVKENEAHKEHVGQLAKENAAHKEHVGLLVKENADLLARISQLEKGLAKAEEMARIPVETVETTSMKLENAQLTLEVSELREKVRELQKMVVGKTQLLANEEELLKKIKTLEEQLTEYKGYRDDNQLLLNEVVSLSKFTQELSSKYKSQKKQYDELMILFESKQTEYEEISKSFEDVKNKLDSYEDYFNEISEKAAYLKGNKII